MRRAEDQRTIRPSLGPLAGIMVVDVSNTFMVPYATLLMAQMGADVVKVEAPEGDILRSVGDTGGSGSGPIFLNANRGKKSVVLDLKKRTDHHRLIQLVKRSDVFVHNRTPRAAQILGIDYGSIGAVNRTLIYCSACGYDSHGPYREMPAYDDVIQSASGIAAIQSNDGEPQYVRTAIADKTTALFVLAGILAALVERERSGLGQAVEVPMFETMVSYLLLEQQGGAVFDPQRGPTGYSRTNSIHRRPYRTIDGLIGVMVYTDKQWSSFFNLIGQPQLAHDQRFATMAMRTVNIDLLYSIVEDVLVTRSTAEWLAQFEEQRIPSMRVNTISDVLEDPQVMASGLLESSEHPSAGRLRTTRLPIRFSRTHAEGIHPAPLLGEHNQWLEDLERSSLVEETG